MQQQSSAEIVPCATSLANNGLLFVPSREQSTVRGGEPSIDPSTDQTLTLDTYGLSSWFSQMSGYGTDMLITNILEVKA